MKISATSDIHGTLINNEDKFWTPGNVLCIAGDISPLEIQHNLIKMNDWMNNTFIPWVMKLPYEYVVLTPGNHDYLFDPIFNTITGHEAYIKYGSDDYTSYSDDIYIKYHNFTNGKLHVLIDRDVNIEGINFYGTPWVSGPRNWPFYLHTKELRRKYENISANTDILITHQPPQYEKLGVVNQYVYNYGVDYGSQVLFDIIDEKKPSWVLCGHIHSGCHTPLIHNNTNMVNVSLTDEMYVKKYDLFSFEFQK